MTTLEQLKLAARDGRINRRDFVKQSAALGLTVAAAGTLANSVALAEEPQKAATTALPWMTATPPTASIRQPMKEASRSVRPVCSATI